MVMTIILLPCQSIEAGSLSEVFYGGGPIRSMTNLDDGTIVGGRSTGHSIQILSSSNQGKTWAQIGTVANNENISYGDIMLLAVPNSSKVFCAFREKNAENKYAVTVCRSDDNGVNWVYDSTVIGGCTQFVGAPWLFLAENGDLQCYYDSEPLATENGVNGAQWIAMQGKDGLTGGWNKYGVVAASRDKNAAKFIRDGMASVVGLGNNRIMVVTEGIEDTQSGGVYSNVVRAIQSFDGGRTWDYNGRRIVYQCEKDAASGKRYNAYCPMAIRVGGGPVGVIFCTDEDFGGTPDASNAAVTERRTHIKYVRTLENFETWGGKETVWSDGNQAYAPGMIETASNEILISIDHFSGHQRFIKYDVLNNNENPFDGDNIALNKTATASSIEDNNAQMAASKAVDGDAATRWSSDSLDNQYITVDLGNTYSLNGVRLLWEAAYATNYHVDLSTDGTNWTTAYTDSSADGGTDNISLSNPVARYIRVYGVNRATVYGISLYEVQAYGTLYNGGGNEGGGGNSGNTGGYDVTYGVGEYTNSFPSGATVSQITGSSNFFGDFSTVPFTLNGTWYNTYPAGALVYYNGAFYENYVAGSSAWGDGWEPDVHPNWHQIYLIDESQPSTVAATGIDLYKNGTKVTSGASETVSDSAAAITFTAAVTPDNATNKGYTLSVNNSSVASVNGDRVVVTPANATADTSVTITATSADGGFTASYTVNIDYTEPVVTVPDAYVFKVGDNNAYWTTYDYRFQTDVPCQFVGGVTYVPFRVIANAAGAKSINYNSAAGTIVITNSYDMTFNLTMDSKTCTVTAGGQTSTSTLNAAPTFIDGACCLPIRDVSNITFASVAYVEQGADGYVIVSASALDSDQAAQCIAAYNA